MKRLSCVLCNILIFSFLLGFLPATAARSVPLPLQGEEWEMLLLTNRERFKAGKAPLSTNDFLQEAGDIRAEELKLSFSHDRPDGESCFTVMRDVGAPQYSAAGENVAIGYQTPQAVVDAWMNSSGHQANMMEDVFVHVGVAVAPDSRCWVQFFYTGFDCAYTEMRLSLPESCSFAPGTTIDDMGITAVLHCKNCGTSYLPVMAEFCSGYDPNRAGNQTVRVSCLGQTAEFNVTITSGEAAPSVPELPIQPQPPAGQNNFVDVSPSVWYYDSVSYAVKHGLMNGVGNNRFDPEKEMTRAMLVTVLWRCAGSPEDGENIFHDVKNGLWYTQAVAWAAEHAVVTGVASGRFDPEGAMTREQLATVLYRYSTAIGMDVSKTANLNGFPDGGKTSGWAKDALSWAVAEGLITGSKDGRQTCLEPQGSASRAQVATILMRFIENVLSEN